MATEDYLKEGQMGFNGSRIKYLATFLTLTLVLMACGGSDGDGQVETTASTGSNTTADIGGTIASDDTLVPEPDSSADNLAAVSGCDLISEEEIAAVTLSPVASSRDIELPQGCSWETDNGGEVSFVRFAGNSLSSDTCDGQVFFISGDEEEISGLGDYAIWGSSGVLVVCRSDVVMRIDIDYSPSTTIEQDRDSAIAMARSVLAQMDG